jgi:hypothetical protein
VVYAKPPFGGPQQVLEYLGRYTHRVAISNHRLLSLAGGQVTFQWKDYRCQDRQACSTLTLEADEFIRRFLIHTLPPGFQRIRHFGFLANCHRKPKLALCRQLLTVPILELLPPAADCGLLLQAICPPTSAETNGINCPRCGIGTMIRLQTLSPYRWPATPPPDTS